MQEKKTIVAREIDISALFSGLYTAGAKANTTGQPQTVRVNDYAGRVHYSDGTAADVQPAQNDSEKGAAGND